MPNSLEDSRAADREHAGRQRDIQQVQLARLEARQILDGFQETVGLAGGDDAARERREFADVVLPPERSRAERMGVRHRDLVLDPAAVVQEYLDAPAERLLARVGGMV